ncbi:MAG: SUMF1/EgtB/PvdO family nonheme iron enzyme [Verrucomicrobiales bacterium]|nr:SUMF1/EgtB/PvdO family nonheme iron enzyme [Verrucomicrobiales bacterium]
MPKLRWILLSILFCLVSRPCQAVPLVTNLTAGQRPGTMLVDIGFDLFSFGGVPCSVRLEFSIDGGITWAPALTATGDIGEPVSPGSAREIVWNAGVDWVGRYSDRVRFRVKANDVLTPGLSFIPSGTFQMGNTSGDTDVASPPVTVSLSSFYLSQLETTKAQWDEVRNWAAVNGYTDLPVGGGKAANHPVHSVSWFDAVKWCNARSEREGLTPCYRSDFGVLRYDVFPPSVDWTANGYRLPTEAEWERAARGGGEGFRFPHGTDFISHNEANYFATGTTHGNESGESGYHPSYRTGLQPYTSPVGSFAANAFGLKDMSGNIWELCWDSYSSTYYNSISGAVNPRGPTTAFSRVRRGGSWRDASFSARASARGSVSSTGGANSLGFRVARSSTGNPSEFLSQIMTLADTTLDTRSDNAFLGTLLIQGAAMNPFFDPLVTSYHAAVSSAVATIRLTTDPMEPNAVVYFRINEGSYTGLTPMEGVLVSLAHGDTLIEVRVDAQDGRTVLTYTIVVNRGKASQVIEFSPIEDRLIAEPVTLSATGGGSSNPVVFTVSSGPAVIEGADLTFTGPGTVKVIASQEGDATHHAASAVVMTFRVVEPGPDVAAGAVATSLTGVGIYDPVSQQVAMTSNKALPVSGIFSIANRAVLPDRKAEEKFTLHGSGGGAYFRVLYLGPDGNVTAGLLAGTAETPVLDHSDEPMLIRMAVTPDRKKLAKKKGKRTVTLRKSQRFSIRATSSTYAPARDEASIVVGTR